MKFLIKSVDTDGFCGREYHPAISDIGLVVTAIGMETYLIDENHHETYLMSKLSEPVSDVGDFNAVIEAEKLGEAFLQRMWTCVTPDGRVLNLMDFEIVLVGLEKF